MSTFLIRQVCNGRLMTVCYLTVMSCFSINSTGVSSSSSTCMITYHDIGLPRMFATGSLLNPPSLSAYKYNYTQLVQQRNSAKTTTIGSSKSMAKLEFRTEVEIWPFCARTMKSIHYGPYLWTNRRNTRVLQEIGLKEVDGYVRFQTGCKYMAS